jgi:hypothetical protein
MSPRPWIETLNSLSLGELDVVRARVLQVRDEVVLAGFEEIGSILDAAIAALLVGDLKNFRRRVNHAVSRLGHIKQPQVEPAL